VDEGGTSRVRWRASTSAGQRVAAQEQRDALRQRHLYAPRIVLPTSSTPSPGTRAEPQDGDDGRHFWRWATIWRVLDCAGTRQASDGAKPQGPKKRVPAPVDRARWRYSYGKREPTRRQHTRR